MRTFRQRKFMLIMANLRKMAATMLGGSYNCEVKRSYVLKLVGARVTRSGWSQNMFLK